MQEADFKWFLENQDKLFAQYGKTYVVIKNKRVIATYPTFAEAVKKTKLKEELGTFIVQKCSDSAEDYTNYVMTPELSVI